MLDDSKMSLVNNAAFCAFFTKKVLSSLKRAKKKKQVFFFKMGLTTCQL